MYDCTIRISSGFLNFRCKSTDRILKYVAFIPLLSFLFSLAELSIQRDLSLVRRVGLARKSLFVMLRSCFNRKWQGIHSHGLDCHVRHVSGFCWMEAPSPPSSPPIAQPEARLGTVRKCLEYVGLGTGLSCAATHKQ